MIESISSPLFAVFTVVLVLESIKTLFLGTATAYSRTAPKQFLNKEDADWLGGEAVTVDHPVPARFMRAHRNNLENLLPFFILGWLFGVSGANASAGLVYFVAFFLARSTHTFAYLSKRPMLRRNAYVVAWLALIVMGGHAAYAILGTSFSNGL